MGVAATGDPQLAEEGAAVSAAQLRDLGINLNFAPVADVLRDPHNPVLGTRAYSDDPGMVAQFTGASVRGHRRGGVASTAKHFPGHGGTPTDSHLDLPEVRDSLAELRELDLVPFRRAVEAGVDCLMLSHVWYTALDEAPTPATLSSRVVALAREGLGFDGVITTDCLEMGAIQRRMSTGDAARRAVLAGCDLPIVSHRLDRQEEALDALTDAVLDGSISKTRIERSLQRLESLRAGLTAPSTGSPAGEDGLPQDLARRSVTLLRNQGNVLPLQVAPDDTVAVIRFVSPRSEAESESGAHTLGAEVARRHERVVDVEVDLDRTNAEDAIRAAASADACIVATAFVTGDPKQGEIVERILEHGKRVVVVATRDPFDICAFPQVGCYLATYGTVPVSIAAAVALIFGELAPAGRLPVELPGLHQRGSGLAGRA
jgi:beta-N-acetylhexosaminidase